MSILDDIYSYMIYYPFLLDKKTNYNSLISEVKILLSIFKYKWKTQKLIMDYVFSLALLLKKF